MDKLGAMQVFIRVAEMASFTKASESLGRPKASVSMIVSQLEEEIGTRLFQRTTRRVQMTHDGQHFYQRCKDLLSDAEEISGMFQTSGTNLTGRLRIDMPYFFARNFIFPRMPEFLAKYPHLELEVSSTDRRVDVIREGFDCVLRVGSLPDSGLMAKNLGQLKIVNCVHRSYIEKYGRPKNLEDLSRHLLVNYVPTLGAKSDGFEFFDGQKCRYTKMKSIVSVNNSDAYVAACNAGLGIIQAPLVGLRAALKSGELVEVLSKFPAEPMPVTLVYPQRRNVARRVQVFMEWIQDIVKDYLA